jgi:hypothetical protein
MAMAIRSANGILITEPVTTPRRASSLPSLEFPLDALSSQVMRLLRLDLRRLESRAIAGRRHAAAAGLNVAIADLDRAMLRRTEQRRWL